jgi:MFS family permease
MPAEKTMKQFAVIWLGQIVSLLGSAMTWFAFTIWAWEKTGQPSTMVLLNFLAFLPMTLLSPFAGALVDRSNRKLVMMFSDMATALGTLIVFILYLNNALEIWHLYVIGFVAGCFGAFQYPAYISAMTMIVPKEHYARAEGMMGVAYASSMVLGPAFGAILLEARGMAFVMSVDLLTFLAAFGTLLWAHIPQPPVSEIGRQNRGSLWQDMLFGFRYIYKHAGLFSLMRIVMATGFFLAIGTALITPMILSRSNSVALAAVRAAGALGGIVGGALLSVWGGPKRRIHGVLLFGAAECLLGLTWLGASSTLLFWTIGNFFFSFFEPFVEGSDLSIWQSKVEADVQGRVFSARYALGQIPFLAGFGVSILFARNFEGTFVSQFDMGAIMSLVMVATGVVSAIIFLFGYLSRDVREVASV